MMFKQYTPYLFNHELINSILYPVDDPKSLPHGRLNPSTDPLNTSSMSVWDMLLKLERIPSGDISCTFYRDFLSLTIAIDKDWYVFKACNAAAVLRAIIDSAQDIMRESKIDNLLEAFRTVIDSTWFYTETDTSLDGPPINYKFFLCQGDQLLCPRVWLSDWLDSEFPSNMLVEYSDPNTTNEIDDQAALVRLNYEQWITETTPGRIYAMKCKMEKEQDIKEDPDSIHDDLPTADPNALLLKEVSLLRREIRFIKIILIVIAVLLVIVMK